MKYDLKGRPLWQADLNKETPAPNSYFYKSYFKSMIDQAKSKPNKC